MRELVFLVALWSVLLGTAGGGVARAAVAAGAVVPARMSVLGTVIDRRSAWEGGTIVTRTRLRVDRVMQGDAPPSPVVEVTELGGRVGDLAQVVLGQPTMPRQPSVAVELTPVAKTWRMTAVLEQVASVDPAGPLHIGAVAYVRTTNKDSEPPCDGEQKDVYWPVANVHYALDSVCSQDVDVDACEAAVTGSFQTWQDVDCSYLSFTYDGRVADAPIGFDRSGPNVNVVKWQEDEWPGDPKAQAITLVTLGCGSGRLLDADILVNGAVGTFSTADLQEEGTVDVQNTVTHEAGHLIGFAHSSDPESTMFSTAVQNETTKRDLTADDSQGLCDAYPLGHEPHPGEGCACAMARGTTIDPTGGATLWGGVIVLLLRAGRRRR